MERREEYEPMIVDLQKSQAVKRPKQYLPIIALSLLVLGIGAIIAFATLYYPNGNPQLPIPSNGSQVTPQPRVQVQATPTPVETQPAPSPAETQPNLTPVPPQPTAIPAIAMGFLSLYSYPEHAAVIIDGQSLGYTPLQHYEIPPGEYTVKFSHEGKLVERQIRIAAGQTTEYTHRFEGFGSLLIETTSSGSDVYVNDRFEGQSPLKVEGLSPGMYRIVVKKVGYATVEKTVTLTKGEHQKLLITIKRLDLVPDPSSEGSSDSTRTLHPSDRQQNNLSNP